MRPSVYGLGLGVLVAALAACGGGGSSGGGAGVTPTVAPSSSSNPTSGPTSTSSPTTGPTSSPTNTPLAAYCSSYASASGGVPLNITDDSGTGAVLIVYVSNGTNFMDASGNFTQSTAYPIPAACFSTTVGSSATNKPLNIPAGVSGRVYFAYATPAPSASTVPNPMTGVSVSGPNVGYSTTPYPWDKIEFGSFAGATIDTTQVDALGLPLELSVGTSGPLPSGGGSSCTANALPVVGVTSCNFGQIFTTMATTTEYRNLVVAQSFNGKLLDMQIVAPKDAVAFTGFQWNLFDLNTYMPTASICPASPTDGYLSCLLNAYNTSMTSGRLFQTTGLGVAGASGDNYCATSDGVSNFIFTDVGSATSCAGATAATSSPAGQNGQAVTFHMPIQELTYGVPPAADGGGSCKQNILFSQPWGNANVGTGGHIFLSPDAFAMWKDLTADINRGTMLSTSVTHPVGVTNPTLSMFFQDPMFNTYAKILHTYFDSNLAYALAYDDLGGFESGVTLQSGDSINVRINAIPTASSASLVPSPVSVPSPCPNLPTGVGTN